MNQTLTLTALSLGMACFLAAPAVAQEQPAETRAQTITRLIKELGADGEGSYDVRENAQKQLEAIGAPALPALQEATRSKDLEVASRAADAISKIRGDRPEAPKPEAPEDELRRGAPQPIPQPDMDEVLKELERQMPDGLGKIFRQFFDNGQDKGGKEKAAEQDEERRPDGLPRPRVRTWTWQLGPNGTRPQNTNDPNAALGIGTGPCSAALRAQLSIPKLEGRVVNRVIPGGYAERNGIKLHDVIVAVDGRAVRRGADLKVLLEKGCKLELFRKAKLHTLELPKASPSVTRPKPEGPKPKTDDRKERSF